MKEVILAIIICILISISLSYLIYKVDQEACKQKTISFKDYKYNAISGCMVLNNNKWLPLKNIREFR